MAFRGECLTSFNQEPRNIECRGRHSGELIKPRRLERRSIAAKWMDSAWRLAPATSNGVQPFTTYKKADDAAGLRHGNLFGDTIEAAR
jgi:hypothetical protein